MGRAMTERPTAEEFAKLIKDHVVTVLHEDGVYRHLRCAKPGTNVEHFEIVTWPGYLAYTGDMGAFTFWRTDDMFEFFRHDDINPGYWAQKLEAVDRRDGHEEFSLDAFREAILDATRIRLDIEDGAPIPQEARDEIAHLLRADDEIEAWSRLRDHRSKLVPLNNWDYDCKVYTYRFIFCCWAIVWAIKEYDRMKGEKRD